MIYLFNSAFTATYFENLYRIVGLPDGVRIDMRYTASENAPRVETDAKFKGRECVICYVDRFDDYLYYPCRKGTIRSVKREQGRVYYNIELREHCHSPTPPSFSERLKTSSDSFPRLTNNDPTFGLDGVYCIEGPDADDLIEMSTDSWSRVVNQIYSSTKFRERVPAFFFSKLQRNSTPAKGGQAGLRLHANTEYHLTVIYKYPIERSDGGRRSIIVRMGPEINRELSVGSDSDKIVIPFNLPPLDYSAGAITIRTIAEFNGSATDELCYTADIPFRTAAWCSNIWLFGLLFLVSFLSEFHRREWVLSDVSWLSTLFEFLKFAVVVWAIFTYRGKLKLPGI